MIITNTLLQRLVESCHNNFIDKYRKKYVLDFLYKDYAENHIITAKKKKNRSR